MAVRRIQLQQHHILLEWSVFANHAMEYGWCSQIIFTQRKSEICTKYTKKSVFHYKWVARWNKPWTKIDLFIVKGRNLLKIVVFILISGYFRKMIKLTQCAFWLTCHILVAKLPQMTHCWLLLTLERVWPISEQQVFGMRNFLMDYNKNTWSTYTTENEIRYAKHTLHVVRLLCQQCNKSLSFSLEITRFSHSIDCDACRKWTNTSLFRK